MGGFGNDSSFQKLGVISSCKEMLNAADGMVAVLHKMRSESKLVYDIFERHPFLFCCTKMCAPSVLRKSLNHRPKLRREMRCATMEWFTFCRKD